MKPLRLLLFALLAAGLTVAVLLVTFVLTRDRLPAGTQALPYQFSVAEYPGIDAGVDIFRLGAITPNSASFRLLSITDPYAGLVNSTESKRVRIFAVGEGSEWLRIDPGESFVPVVVNISVRVPDSAPLGLYKGTILVIPVREIEANG